MGNSTSKYKQEGDVFTVEKGGTNVVFSFNKLERMLFVQETTGGGICFGSRVKCDAYTDPVLLPTNPIPFSAITAVELRLVRKAAEDNRHHARLHETEEEGLHILPVQTNIDNAIQQTVEGMGGGVYGSYRPGNLVWSVVIKLTPETTPVGILSLWDTNNNATMMGGGGAPPAPKVDLAKALGSFLGVPSNWEEAGSGEGQERLKRMHFPEESAKAGQLEIQIRSQGLGFAVMRQIRLFESLYDAAGGAMPDMGPSDRPLGRRA